jgi:hypothetical protein
MLNLIIIFGLLNTTLLICFRKWKWIELYTIHRRTWMPAADCYLCLGFWLAVLQVIPIAILRGPEFLIVPFCSATITNYLTNLAIIHDYNKGR